MERNKKEKVNDFASATKINLAKDLQRGFAFGLFIFARRRKKSRTSFYLIDQVKDIEILRNQDLSTQLRTFLQHVDVTKSGK